MRYIVFFAFALFALPSFAQRSDDNKSAAYDEVMPSHDFDINEYLASNMVYPKEARNAKIEGRVVVKFVVNEDGSVGDVSILKGIGGGCDEEAKRVVLAMPKWKPGEQNGKKVKVYFTLPINFKLQDDGTLKRQKIKTNEDTQHPQFQIPNP